MNNLRVPHKVGSKGSGKILQGVSRTFFPHMVRRRFLSRIGSIILVSSPSFAADSVSFDGVNDWLEKSPNGIWDNFSTSDEKIGITSFWYYPQGSDDQQDKIFSSGSRYYIEKRSNSGSNYVVQYSDVSGSARLNVTSNTGVTNAKGWQHLLFAWDRTAGTGASHLYINNVDCGGLMIATNADSTVGSDCRFMRSSASVFAQGYVAEMYMMLGETIDLSVAGNRAKFAVGGVPVDLGDTGTLPTGNQPHCYFSRRVGDAVADFYTNRGKGGTFVEGAGSGVSDPSSLPSY